MLERNFEMVVLSKGQKIDYFKTKCWNKCKSVILEGLNATGAAPTQHSWASALAQQSIMTHNNPKPKVTSHKPAILTNKEAITLSDRRPLGKTSRASHVTVSSRTHDISSLDHYATLWPVRELRLSKRPA